MDEKVERKKTTNKLNIDIKYSDFKLYRET